MLKLSDYKLLDKSRHTTTFTEVVELFNDTVTAYPSDKTIHSIFREMANRYPLRIAIEWLDNKGEMRQMTYSQLDELSDRIAISLKSGGIGIGDIVTVQLNRTANLIASLLGILKCGAAYISIETGVPFQRKKYILNDTAARAIIAEKEFKSEVIKLHQACPTLQIALYTDDLPDIPAMSDEWQQLLQETLSGNPRNLAYICYTSGTTGNPKGVLIEHRGVVRLVKNTNYIDICPDDKLLQGAPISFDASTFEIWGALLNGAGLYIIKKEDLLVPATFERIMQMNDVTISWLTTSLFNHLYDEAPHAFSKLKKLLVGGDVVSPEHINRIREMYPFLEVINGYGPTENTTFSACFLIDQEYTSAIPVGRPVSNSQCYILNKSLQPVPVGITGDLFVAGDGLARGYLNDPELTAERFIDSPFRPGEKMYRTGDLAKWLPEGIIRFVGRQDDQVKINGHRIETGEIESKIREVSGIKQVVVAIRKDRKDEKYLCAYFVPVDGTDAALLKTLLSAHLPDYMVPAYFVEMEILPLNANGKVDRHALPDPGYLQHHTADEASAISQLQKILLDIWKAVLGHEWITIKDNFFSIGGHSLKATQIISRIRKELGMEIGIADIFTYPTVMEQSRLLEGRKAQQGKGIENAGQQQYYDLSYSQQRLWILDQFAEGRVAYNIPAAFRIKGLHPATLEKAFQTLIARHESLRTVFNVVDDIPKQQVLDDVAGEFQLTLTDFSNRPDAADVIENEIRAAAAEPFDLTTWPLLHARVWHLDKDEYILFVSIHHIVSDAWSLKVMISELYTLYTAYRNGIDNPLIPLRIQYRDYVSWMQQQRASKGGNIQKLYWYQQLAGDLPVLELPADFRRPAVKTSSGDYIVRKLSTDMSAAVRQYAQKKEVSLFMMLVAALKVLFNRYTGQEDILVGTNIAGRGHEDLEALIGFFVNTLPVRTKFSATDFFDDILYKVKTALLNTYDNQGYPLDQLIDELKLRRDLSRNPLFDVMVGFQNTGLENSLSNLGDELQIDMYPISFVASKVDLDILFEESGGEIRIRLEFNTDIFRRERMLRLLDHYITLLDSILTNSQLPVWQLEFIPPPEKELLLSSGIGPSPDLPSGTLCRLFEAQAIAQADKNAVISGEDILTYGQLNVLANKCANNLINKFGIKPGDLVGVIMDRSERLVAVLMGILKAGAAYVPIDPSYPAARITYVLSDASVKLVICNTASQVPDGILQVQEDILMADTAAVYESNPLLVVTPDDLAYVIYTSGTTGQPKGVMITHAALVNFLISMQQYPGIHQEDVLLAVTSYSFDISVLELFLPLVSGATVILPGADIVREPSLLLPLMKDERPTIMQATPSMWRILRESGWEGDAKLKVLCGGEALPYELGGWLLKNTGELWNMYGPTETTIWSIIKHITNTDDLGSIGKPIAHTQIYILDQYNQFVPAGWEGELCIAGRGLSRGYLHRETLTQQKFVWHNEMHTKIYKTGDRAKILENGEIRFMGRRDNQVKLHGYRIELEEIETLLMQFPGIGNAAVCIAGDDMKSTLAAYIVAPSFSDIDGLRRHLSSQLPAFMVPQHIVFVEQLPLTSNGKLDRASLPHISGQVEITESLVAPVGETEERLLEKWKNILGREEIGTTDNFFEKGGHSLMATQLVSWISREFNVKLLLKDIFNHPTVKGQSQLLETTAFTQHENIPLVPAAPTYKLSHAQYRLWVLDQMQEEQVAYNMPGAFELTGSFSEEAFRKTVFALISRHESLRTTFIVVDGTPRQKIHLPGEMAVSFSSVDLRGESDPAKKAAQLADTEAETPFDLENGPLLRTVVLQTADDHHILLFTMHHIISDGWSMGILIKEAQILYSAFCQSSVAQLPALRIQYKDFAEWQHHKLTEGTDEQYWLDKLAGPLEKLRLPYDYAPSSTFSFNGKKEYITFDASVTSRLKEMALQHNSSLSNAVFTLFNILLFNITGQENVVVGVAVANRNHVELENIIGFFVNSLVIKNTIQGDTDFLDLLQQVSQNMIAAFDHQGYPFDMLVEKICPERTNTHQPLFNVFYGFQNFSDINLEVFEKKIPQVGMNSDNALSWMQQRFNTSKFDLTLFVFQQPDTLQFMLEYNSDLFTTDTIQRYLNYFNRIAIAITETY